MPTRTESDQLTIDELARASGVTVRNIRAYQSRRLLPPPRLRGRTGYYGREHADRLRLIQDLQDEGFSLRSIGRLLEGVNGSSADVLTFKRAVAAPFTSEAAEVVGAAELQRRFGGEADQRLVQRAERLGLLRYLGSGQYEVPSPRLLRAGEQLVALGIPLRHAVAVAGQVLRHAEAISESFLRLFIQDVMEPLRREEGPPDWQAARATVDRLRPLALEVLSAAFEQTMTQVVERELGRIIEA